MQISYLHIKNFKSIRDLEIRELEQALILVGKNNTGKTSILDAVRAACLKYQIQEADFNEKKQNIEITVTLLITEEDLRLLHQYGRVSQYKRYPIWHRVFCERFPSYQKEEGEDKGRLTFTWIFNYEGNVRCSDGYKKNNIYIREILPRLYHIDTERELHQLQDDLLLFQENDVLNQMRADTCMFDRAKQCSRCFQCVGLINQKTPAELTAVETAKLLEYKMYNLNLYDFSRRVNENFYKNGGYEEIHYNLQFDIDQVLRISAETWNEERKVSSPVEHMGKGMRSIYMLSLLEAYIEGEDRIPSIILVEDPEIFLHPQLQKTASQILYRLSKKNQVIFKTHSPNMLFNFSTRQIRQVVLDRDRYSVIKEKTDIDQILDDLGYTANDFLNVGFVFIVEGKQDKSRLPLLLEKYYSEVRDKNGNLSRISIITTNSCTNIKTYANLKYMNQVYLRDQFLMIRDGDGKDADELKRQLCRYYDERNLEDVDKLPKVTRRNVLILKYYSFENYFLNPAIMAQVGIVKSEEDFYRILFQKWQEYLHRLSSGRHLTAVLGHKIDSVQDLKAHMEEFKIYMRGHNLFDIFYGPFKKREKEILTEYIALAPRDEFEDILDAIDGFIYFESRRKEEEV